MEDYLRNCWYMAAWGHEIGQGMLRRRLLDEPLVLFRKADGAPVAFVDRCPHRFARLSEGTLDNDCVTCPYHGLIFDASGRCVGNPFSDQIPKGAQVRSFPVTESDNIIWFWPGDPDLADPATIPDFSMLEVEGHGRPLSGHMPMNAPYEFGTDNLLDLSHIEFVHKGSFAPNGVIFAGEHQFREEGNILHSNWWMPGVAAPGHTIGIYERGSITDHWLDMRWQAPASMYLQVGACRQGENRDENPVLVHQAHILTPETEQTSHYFWATTRSLPPEEESDAELRAMFEQAFVVEDKPIIEQSYANMDGVDFWDLGPAFLGVDRAGTRARRKLQAMIKREQAGS